MDVAAREGRGGGVVIDLFDGERPRGGRGGTGASVRTGVVLVGTVETIRQMAAAVGVMSEPPVIAGAVVADKWQIANGKGLIEGGGPVALPVPLLGTVEELPLLVARFGLKMALVCGGARVREAVARAGLPVREFLAMEEVLAGSGAVSPAAPSAFAAGAANIPPPEGEEQRMRNRFVGAAPAVDLGALIGRTPYDMDREAIGRVLRGKRVVITGAGGSIGSELARVAAEFEPAQLVLMERSENALFEIDRRIGTLFPGVKRRAVLHDVADAEGTLRVCGDIRPHAVFHSAAHKHVPLMEDHPAHAVTNNLFGTKSIADAAVACGAERFVMISSDKAVNPTSVMGATKRLAEMYVRGMGEAKWQIANGKSANESQAGTRLSMVRFGNVLGSSASVLTIWAQQIAEGGPLTITDPRMTRYFMTIPEAATLVVQSTVLGDASSVGVFVLDMGEPIRIVDLAVRFAAAHGVAARVRAETAGTLGRELVGRYPEPTPGVPTVDLVFSGIRPGEKLHEELAYAAEQLRATTHPGIRTWAGPGFDADTAGRVREMVAELHAARFSQDRAAVLAAIRRHVPEMRSMSDSASGGQPTVQTLHPQVG